MATLTDTQVVNIAAFLPQMAAERPHAPAIYYPEGRNAAGRVLYSHYTYAQLNRHSDLIAAGLEQIGVTRGTRTVLMVKPSLEFFALTFAIFKAGAIPVMVDPGIGIKNLGVCLAEAEPEAFIGIPRAHVARVILGWARKSVQKNVTVGRKLFWGGHTLEDVKALGAQRPDWRMASTTRDEMAAILFTSGSTGIPKGVTYTHGNFVSQVNAIRDMYDIRPGEIDLPTFPLFALFDPALGMTTVVPDMDFTKPAQVDPRKISEAIEDFGITNMFGSPALLNTVSRWGESTGTSFSTIRRVISAGAPVPSVVLQRMAAMLPEDARIYTPYGATESLPVASISHREVLGETRAMTDIGKGVCVGYPVPTIDLKIIRLRTGPTTSSCRKGKSAKLLCRARWLPGRISIAKRRRNSRKYTTPMVPFGTAWATSVISTNKGASGSVVANHTVWSCGRASPCSAALSKPSLIRTPPCFARRSWASGTPPVRPHLLCV